MKCANCKDEFIPKKGGHNARYCEDRCKRAAHRARLRVEKPYQLQNARKRSYQRIKNDPDKMLKHLLGGRKYRRIVREWLAEYKLKRGCADCGYKGHAAALQLDHEGTKSVSISDARSSLSRLQAEIKNGKCKVRCANCHAVKTWERQYAKT